MSASAMQGGHKKYYRNTTCNTFFLCVLQQYCNRLTFAILHVNLVHTSQPKKVNDLVVSSVFTCRVSFNRPSRTTVL